MIEGVEEIIGQEDLQKLLNLKGIPFDYNSHQHVALRQSLTIVDLIEMEHGLEEMFGENGSRGAALRAGRCFFQNLFQKYGIGSGLNSLEFRMQPLKKRILAGLGILSALLSDSIQLDIHISENESKWYWTYEDRICCRDENEKGLPVFDFFIGLLQNYLSWASGGKAYPIQKCQDLGATCVIEIGKNPIG